MERAGVLINKLQEQLTGNANINNMLVTVQLLHKELLIQARETEQSGSITKVSVVVPNAIPAGFDYSEPVSESYKPVPKPETQPEPLPEPMPGPSLPVPGEVPPSIPHPHPEPEPIPHFQSFLNRKSLFTTVETKREEPADFMTINATSSTPQKIVYELNDVMVSEGYSMNERLKEEKTEMSAVLQGTPIGDLRRAISINDRHRFIHELFRDDEAMYERSMKTINNFKMYPEAEFWIQRELLTKLGWDPTNELVKTFDQLVRRRFS